MRMSEDRLGRVFWAGVGALILVAASFVAPIIVQSVFTRDVVPRHVAARRDLASDEKTTIELFQKAKGSVVYINTSQRVMDLWTRNVFTIPKGTGSGFVRDEGGNVVTNLRSSPVRRTRAWE